jgi:hypothetical protein
MVDISEWASDEVHSIHLSQIFLEAPYEIKVREFVPMEGDRLDKVWQDGAVTRRMRIPSYAIANMREAAQAYHALVENNIATYIRGVVGQLDGLIPKTYYQAYRHLHDASVSPNRPLQGTIELPRILV